MRAQVVNLAFSRLVLVGDKVHGNGDIAQAHVDLTVRGLHVDHYTRVGIAEAEHAAFDRPALGNVEREGFFGRILKGCEIGGQGGRNRQGRENSELGEGVHG